MDRSKDISFYTFDLIVMNMYLPTVEFEDLSSVEVDCKFRDWDWRVPANKLNVIDFPKDDGFPYKETIKELRTALETFPIEITVATPAEVIGFGKLLLPQTLCDKIETLTEAVYFAKVELISAEESTGCIDILVKFQPFCKEEDIKIYPDPACPHIDAFINPNDVIFVVGDPQKLFPCPADNPLLKDKTTTKNLDFSRYMVYQGAKLSKAPSLPNTSCSLNCARFQEVVQKYGSGIAEKLICVDSKKGRPSKQTKVGGRCIKLSISPDISESESEEICCPDVPKTPGFTIPMPDFQLLKQMKKKFCPICRTNMKYLPALAACPICGYKPAPIAKSEKKIYQVDDIVEEYCDKQFPQIKCPKKFSCDDVEEQYESKECQCRCLPGYICPYCRVRNICNVKTKAGGRKPKKFDHQSAMNYQEDVDDAAYQENRPYLERVFSEFRSIYRLGPQNKKRQSGGTCRLESDKPETKMDFSKSLPRSTACTDIANIRKDPRNRRIFAREKMSRKAKSFKVQRTNKCKYLPKIAGKPRCGKCSPLGCLPCSKPFKNKCGNKLYDYCADRGHYYPKRNDHLYCVDSNPRVPCDMGWLWNINSFGRGWKPGALPKRIKKLMSYFLIGYPADTLVVSKYCKYRYPPKKRFTKVKQQTTLEIQKKNNEYLITFRPLKDYESLKTAVDPFLDMKPIQVKIVEDPCTVKIRELKKCLISKGYGKCICKQPVVKCCCRTRAQKLFLLADLETECKRRGLENCAETIVLDDEDDSNESDDEYCFELTPPAGIVKYSNMNKPDYAHKDTQYTREDFYQTPVFGKKLNVYEKVFKEQIVKAKKKEKAAELAKKTPPVDPLDKMDLNVPPEKQPVLPPPLEGNEARIAEVYERVSKNTKLARYIGKDGRFSMQNYIKKNPLLKGSEAAAARLRRLRLLLEEIPFPFELKSKRDRAFNACCCINTCTCCNVPCCSCNPCNPCGPCGPCGPC